jgi:hypothetical protein
MVTPFGQDGMQESAVRSEDMWYQLRIKDLFALVLPALPCML